MARRDRRALWLVAVALVAVLAPAGIRAARTAPTAAPAPGVTPDPAIELRRERVLLVGDSLMQAVVPPLSARLDRLGVTHRALAYPGTGLLEARPVDWQAEAARLVRVFRPTLVVAEFCCNYWPPYATGADGQPIAPHTDRFDVAWAAAADQLAHQLTAGGAHLLWVLTPPSSNAAIDDTIQRINRTTVAAAARADPPLRLLRWDKALTADTGTFQNQIDVDGTPTTVRRSDGLHFTRSGAEVAARATIDALLAAYGNAWHPFDSAERFVTQLRRDFTTRPDDPAATRRDTDRLLEGDVSRAGLVQEYAQAPAWQGVLGPWLRLLDAVGAPPPTPADLAQRLQRAERGTTPQDEARRLLAGPEGRDLTEASDRDFVRLVAQRTGGPDLPELASQSIDNLASGSVTRADVLTLFSESDHHIARTRGRVLTSLVFAGLLSRVPAPDELGDWGPTVGAGGPPASMVDTILASDEYAGRVPQPLDRPRTSVPVLAGRVAGDDGDAVVTVVPRRADAPRERLCSGVVVDPSWVLTTSRCVGGRRADTLDVVTGPDLDAPTGRIAVDRVDIHPTYRDATLDADLALLHLAGSAGVTPLAPAGPTLVATGSGRLVARGAGPSAARALVETDVDLDPAACSARFGPGFHPDTMRCASATSTTTVACAADDGAPVLVTAADGSRRLAGLASWSGPCSAGAPVVLARTDSGDDFLSDVSRREPPFADPGTAVDVLYDAFGGRTPTTTDRATWVAALATGARTRTDLVLGLARSASFAAPRADLVLLYVAWYGSVPDASGYGYWQLNESLGSDLSQVSAALSGAADVAPATDRLDDRQFVARAWEHLFRTAPTAADTRPWTTLLAAGVSRSEVVLGLATTPAARLARQAEVEAVLVHDGLLGRAPTGDETRRWVADAAAGHLDRDVEGLLRSAEFARRY